MTSLEKGLVALEGRWQFAYRTAVGFLILATFRLMPVASNFVMLLVFFLCALLALRIGPVIGRKLIRFSEAAESTWAAQRQYAKRYDSYQWRKLFWIGIGLICYAAVSGEIRFEEIVLSSVCVSAGALGTATWRTRRNRIKPSRAPQGRIVEPLIPSGDCV